MRLIYYQRVVRLIAYRMGVEEETINETTRFIEDLHADNIDVDELTLDIKETFNNLDIPEEFIVLFTLRTVNDVVTYLEKLDK